MGLFVFDLLSFWHRQPISSQRSLVVDVEKNKFLYNLALDFVY